MSAVVAAEPPVAVEHQRDVAIGTTEGLPAGTAVERGCDPAPVEEQDRLASALRDPAELGQERRRERVAGFPAQVDDPNGRQAGADPLA